MTHQQAYSVIYSGLGDTLFPGDDHDSRLLNSFVGELLLTMRDAGKEVSQFNLSETLASFVPKSVQGSTGPWKAQCEQRWLNEQKPQMFKAIGEFFLEGGLFKRFASQVSLLAGLEDAGLEVVGGEALLYQLNRPGNWHHIFVACIVRGRQFGIALRPRAATVVDPNRVGQVMSAAGFGHEQVQAVLCEIRE